MPLTLIRDMPIEKSTWNSKESTESTRTELIEFLREDQSLACTDRELSDEILGSTWGRIHVEEREIARVGEESYHQQNPDYEFDMVDAFLSREKVNRMWNILDDLVYEDVDELRFVPGEKTDIPDASSEVPCYTYSSKLNGHR